MAAHVFGRDPLDRNIERTRAFQNAEALGPARRPHGEMPIRPDQFRAAFVFQRLPQGVSASDQAHVFWPAGVGLADHPRVSVRGSEGMRRMEPVEAGDPHSAFRQMVYRRTAHRAQPGHNNVERRDALFHKTDHVDRH